MKHTLKISLLIILMFLAAQFVGLLVISSYNDYFGPKYVKEKLAAEKAGLPSPPRPEVPIIEQTIPEPIELKQPIDVARIVSSIVIAILLATALFFLLSRVKITILLRVWFAFVVFVCLSISFSLLLSRFYPLGQTLKFKNWPLSWLALPLAAFLTYFKIKRNLIAHNFAEIFLYPGLAVIFLPLLSGKYGITAAALLLCAISFYDAWAVWKTKHMIRLAKFQIKKLKLFTGFFLPYVQPKYKTKFEKLKAALKKKGKVQKLRIKIPVEVAALGGGDVAFPLIFIGTLLIRYSLAASLVAIGTTTLALALLLAFSRKGKFYPAMPFLTAGCFLGLAVFLLF